MLSIEDKRLLLGEEDEDTKGSENGSEGTILSEKSSLVMVRVYE